jgi:hypothetical protein
MSRRKLFSLTSAEPRFVSEQIGVPENEFKEEIVGLFRGSKVPLRTYLARVEYDGINDFNVALCIASEFGEDRDLANDIALVFRRMFDLHEHLDIFFLTSAQEFQLRKVCCPFFTSRRYDHPDFYLTYSDGYHLENFNACYNERRFFDEGTDVYLLCEIDPPIMAHLYGSAAQSVHRVVLTSPQIGFSVFSVNDEHHYVQVGRLTRAVPDDQFVIAKSDIESIGWAVKWSPLSRQ